MCLLVGEGAGKRLEEGAGETKANFCKNPFCKLCHSRGLLGNRGKEQPKGPFLLWNCVLILLWAWSP